MTETTDLGRLVADWLAADGPTELAPEAVETALSRSRQSAQRRGVLLALVGTAPWPGTRRRSALGRAGRQMRVAILVALVVAAILGLAILAAGMWRSTPEPPAQRLAVARLGVLSLMLADGTGEHVVAHQGAGGVKQIAWSPGGTNVAIGLGSAMSHPTQIDEIEVLDADGNHIRQFEGQTRFDWADDEKLVEAPDSPCCWTGVRFAAISDFSLESKVPIEQRGTGIAFGRRPDRGVVVALQDAYVAYPADGGRQWGIDPSLTVRVYLISNDGTRADQVGLLHGFTEAGAISHDGRRVAFLFDDTVLPPSGPACPSGSPCVAILSVDSPQQLCQVPLGELDLGGAGPGQPGVAWSPSDDRIALALPGETRSAVAVVGISTCSLLGSPLATPSAHAGDATLPMLGSPIGWSADGRSLFTRARDPGGPWVVRRIAADGSGSAREIARDVDWFDLSGR